MLTAITAFQRASSNESNIFNFLYLALYYRTMQTWAYGDDWETPGDGDTRPASMFYFAAFDEPWKGADDNWGIWDANRHQKWNPEKNQAQE